MMYKTKVFKESKIKKYWKYVDVTPWTQPIATGNTTPIEEGNMVFTCSSNYSTEPAWLAMDGSMSTNFAFDNKTTGWWQVKFPYTIIVKGLDFYQRGNAGTYRTVRARFYTGSTKTTPIGNEFEASTTSFELTQIVGIPAHGIITDTIYLEITEGVASAGMGELIITADKGSVVPATPDDYDYFTEETTSYKSPAEGYREVAFLRSDGNQYCDTGVVAANEIDCEWTLETFSAYFGVYGNYVDEDTSCYRLIGQGSDNNGIYFTSGYAARLSGGVTLSYREFNRTRVTPSGIYVNDVFHSHSQTGGNSNSTTICVFGTNHTGSFKGCIRYLKMYHNSSLIRDYVPCERTADGVLGLYDKVTNTFITNLGTGSFEKGGYVIAEAPYKVLKSNGKFKVLREEEEYDPYWHQPVLTANGTMGVDDFAVEASEEYTGDPVDHKAFRAFDNDPDTQWQVNNVSSGFSQRLTFYIKEGVKLQSLEITNTSQQYTTSNGGLYVAGSNDGTNWVANSPNLPVEGQTTPSATWTHEVNWDTPYKYFRIYVNPRYTTAIMIAEIKIHALKA